NGMVRHVLVRRHLPTRTRQIGRVKVEPLQLGADPADNAVKRYLRAVYSVFDRPQHHAFRIRAVPGIRLETLHLEAIDHDVRGWIIGHTWGLQTQEYLMSNLPRIF